MSRSRSAPSAPRPMVRQGDVLLLPVDRLPARATVRAREEGRVVLAHGEATGHHHQIADPDGCGAALLDAPNPGDCVIGYLRVDAVSALVHEEHGAIPVEGVYQVRRQREYSPEAVHYVAD